MDNLPHDLKVDILQRVANYGFKYLAPFITGSKATNEAVFSPIVLNSVNLDEFIQHPSMVNKDTTYRSFFLDCIIAGNTTAMELEGLRILSQQGPSESAFAMVTCGGPSSVFGIFVAGVFRICAGDFETGMATLQDIWDNVYDFDEAVEVGDNVIRQIVSFGPANAGLYQSTFRYPIEHAPHCTYVHCEGGNVCETCYGFWYSVIVYTMC